MKLIDYAGLYRKWPPPGRSLHGPQRPAPADCSDSLMIALHFSGIDSPEWDVVIVTELESERFARRISVGEDIIFAQVFAEFLRKQMGKTILEIGHMDVSFLG
jgi:hypothetical protein